MKPYRLALVLLASLPLARPAAADEGMWLPEQIPALAARLKEVGFTGDPKLFADLTAFPMGAVVSLGGCSAAFVSPDGLVATNHHCVQGALQYNSTPERNLLEDGFLARSRAEELWTGPGSRVAVTVSYRDVTDEVRGAAAAGGSDRDRWTAMERKAYAVTAACEKGGLRCRVAPFFEGQRWFEIAQMEIEDVRLVWAPHRGIGNFGGETDNWQWPRHTGDVSFYRAYVGPDGKPAKHARENVPYRPKHHLKISPAGVAPDEVVIVAGYPGRTYRHIVAADLEHRVGWALPAGVRRNREIAKVLKDLGASDPAVRIKAEARLRGLENAAKKNEGILAEGEAMRAAKQAEAKELAAWVKKDPARAAKYAAALAEMERIVAAETAGRERDAVVNGLFAASITLEAARTAWQLAEDRPRPDVERDPEMRERNWPRIRERFERMQRTYDPRLEEALLKFWLREAATLPAGQRIEALDRLAGLKPGDPAASTAAADAYAARLVREGTLGDRAVRVGLLEGDAAAVRVKKDPALELVGALQPVFAEMRERERTAAGARWRVGPTYMEAVLAWRGRPVAPDANSTLRVTFGRVQGVPAKDGLFYLPQTTLAGILEKHTGTGEFAAPARQVEAIRAVQAGRATPYRDPKLGTVPVNYLSDVDTTGGNSGSATLNAKGELVGLLFDGTLETVGSDYVYDTERTRSIHVDSRYVLWLLADVEKADDLLKELGL